MLKILSYGDRSSGFVPSWSNCLPRLTVTTGIPVNISDKQVEYGAHRINSYLGLLCHYQCRRFIRTEIKTHPHILKLYQLTDLRKVVSYRSLERKAHLRVIRKASYLYHLQFRGRVGLRSRHASFKEIYESVCRAQRIVPCSPAYYPMS